MDGSFYSSRQIPKAPSERSFPKNVLSIVTRKLGSSFFDDPEKGFPRKLLTIAE
jgi:hypothetical protein